MAFHQQSESSYPHGGTGHRGETRRDQRRAHDVEMVGAGEESRRLVGEPDMA